METLIQRFDYKQLEEATTMLRAIAHPMRIAIIDLLEGGTRLTVTEIYRELGIEQAAASHHLSILKSRGVLNSEREGKNTFYFLRFERVSQIVDCMAECIEKISAKRGFF